jgi:hypothetical protein
MNDSNILGSLSIIIAIFEEPKLVIVILVVSEKLDK